jgi:hypothetical protein
MDVVQDKNDHYEFKSLLLELFILQKGTHAGCGSLQATRAARKRRRIPHAAVHVMIFKTQKYTLELRKRIFPDHVRMYKHTHVSP